MKTAGRPLLCPSAPPDKTDGVAFGVVQGTADEPRLRHLAEPQPVTDELLHLAAPARPTEVFRFAAPCAGSSCQHFDGSSCRLVSRVVKLLPAVTDDLPPCLIRPSCRWWREQGRNACVRCPQIVTESSSPDRRFIEAAIG